MILGCWKNVHSSFQRHTADWFLNAGNLSILPFNSLKILFVFLLEICIFFLFQFFCWKSVHRFLSISPCKVRSAIPEIWQSIPASQNQRRPLINTLFVHYRAILIQIEPLPAFDIRNTPILEFCLFFLFMRLKAAHFQYWKFVWASNRFV